MRNKCSKYSKIINMRAYMRFVCYVMLNTITKGNATYRGWFHDNDKTEQMNESPHLD